MRSTNVYKDWSLGMDEEEARGDRHEMVHDSDTSHVSIWGRYLVHHVRQQLAFGICF